jgi:glycosyltransferase involved in cell wall biosynthesis
MKVLILAPHPFYQERGTPIAVDMLIRTLSERGDSIDLLTFHEGVDRHYDQLRIFRIKPFPAVRNLRPGFSAKKLYCDIFMFFRFASLLWSGKYDVVHAVEESSFMALLLCPLRSIPFVYDIDSSMTAQLVDQFRILRPFRSLLQMIESLPMRYAAFVTPVCDALADEVRKYRDAGIVVLKDVSLVSKAQSTDGVEDIRKELSLTGKIVMYIGNLEIYQGIDLLLESLGIVIRRNPDVSLIVIGGLPEDIDVYRNVADGMGISSHVHFLGRRPVDQIGQYMTQADILVSTRIQGTNTPMKIYSYLDSGVAVLATRLPTHTQVMSEEFTMLARPDKEEFAKAMLKLLDEDETRARLAGNAREYVRKEHSYSTYKNLVFGLYNKLENGRSDEFG